MHCSKDSYKESLFYKVGRKFTKDYMFKKVF